MKKRYASFLIVLLSMSYLTAQDSAEKIQARARLEQLQKGATPDSVEAVFNDFCNTHFGAEADSLIYDKFGYTLKINATGGWKYASEKSASVSWQTNLPSKSYIEYGTTTAYGTQTTTTDRYYYTHIHHLKNLQENVTYHYRLVCEDERGNIIKSSDSTFTTVLPAGNIVKVPDNLSGPPYVLNQANTTYLFTQDITASKTAIVVLADNITIDLGGHTIIHGDQTVSSVTESDYNNCGAGIYSYQPRTGITIVNGTLKNGSATGNVSITAGYGFNPIYLRKAGDVEIAGVICDYYFSQTHGMAIKDAAGNINIHNNIVNDRGTEITYRHGSGVKAIAFRGGDPHVPNGHHIDYNLIKRSRQNGVNFAMTMTGNEIYIDSWSTNSFAIQPTHKDGVLKDNKMLITGYNAYGAGWSSNDMIFENTFIHMESIITMTSGSTGNRYFETWGDIDCLAGFRITNYNPGGRQRNNLLYKDNLIIGNCRKGAEMRGTEFMTDYSITNTRFENSTVKVMVTDSNSNNRAASIVTHGASNDSLPVPIYYRNCKIISNFCNIRFGDSYARGHHHKFYNSDLIRIGNHPDYHTFVFDGGYWGWDHHLIDCRFLSGATYDDVYWKRTGLYSNYSVGYTLCVNANPGSQITIKDAKDSVVYNGVMPASGVITDTLLRSTIRPVEWTPGGGGSAVNDKYNHQEIVFSPYKVFAQENSTLDSVTVQLDSAQCVYFHGITGIGQVLDESAQIINVYPNPFSTSAIVDFSGLKKMPGDDLNFHLFNTLGEKVSVYSVDGDILLLEKKNMAPGIYFYIVTLNQKHTGTGKLVVQ